MPGENVRVETYNVDAADRRRRKATHDPARCGAVVPMVRESKKWRQVDLAREAGVSANTVNGCELGRRTQIKKLERIARVFGTSVAALARGDIPPISSGVSAADILIAGLSS